MQGAGCRVQGAGCRVQGFGVRPLAVAEARLSRKFRAVELADALLQTLLLPSHVDHQGIVPAQVSSLIEKPLTQVPSPVQKRLIHTLRPVLYPRKQVCQSRIVFDTYISSWFPMWDRVGGSVGDGIGSQVRSTTTGSA